MNNERETCGICSQDYLVKNTKDHQCETDNTDLYLAIIEDISNVIAEHLPRFDNNITAETWKLLEQFTDETITQLTKEVTEEKEFCIYCFNDFQCYTHPKKKEN